MVLHTGTSWGYGALLTLIPDLDISIYTSISGACSINADIVFATCG